MFVFLLKNISHRYKLSAKNKTPSQSNFFMSTQTQTLLIILLLPHGNKQMFRIMKLILFSRNRKLLFFLMMKRGK